MTTYMYRGQRPFVWLGRAEIEIHAHVLRLVRPWKQFGFLLLALLPPAWPPKTRVHKLSLHPINNTNIARIIANYDHTNLGARQKLSTQQQWDTPGNLQGVNLDWHKSPTSLRDVSAYPGSVLLVRRHQLLQHAIFSSSVVCEASRMKLVSPGWGITAKNEKCKRSKQLCQSTMNTRNLLRHDSASVGLVLNLWFVPVLVL